MYGPKWKLDDEECEGSPVRLGAKKAETMIQA